MSILTHVLDYKNEKLLLKVLFKRVIDDPLTSIHIFIFFQIVSLLSLTLQLRMFNGTTFAGITDRDERVLQEFGRIEENNLKVLAGVFILNVFFFLI